MAVLTAIIALAIVADHTCSGKVTSPVEDSK
jgi:hypothetical protein